MVNWNSVHVAILVLLRDYFLAFAKVQFPLFVGFSSYFPLKGWICGKILCKFGIMALAVDTAEDVPVGHSGKRGPWSCEDSFYQCRGIPGPESGRVLVGEQVKQGRNKFFFWIGNQEK